MLLPAVFPGGTNGPGARNVCLGTAGCIVCWWLAAPGRSLSRPCLKTLSKSGGSVRRAQVKLICVVPGWPQARANAFSPLLSLSLVLPVFSSHRSPLFASTGVEAVPQPQRLLSFFSRYLRGAFDTLVGCCGAAAVCRCHYRLWRDTGTYCTKLFWFPFVSTLGSLSSGSVGGQQDCHFKQIMFFVFSQKCIKNRTYPHATVTHLDRGLSPTEMPKKEFPTSKANCRF